MTEDHGVGNDRKLKVSDLARRILHDSRPGARKAALKEAATKPKLLHDYAIAWRTGRPSDEHCVSELTLERGFTQRAASIFLRVFDSNFRFTGLGSSDSIIDNGGGAAEPEIEPEDGGENVVIQPGPEQQLGFRLCHEPIGYMKAIRRYRL